MKRIVLGALVLVAAAGLVAVLFTPGGRAQVNLSVEPTMTRGAPTAKVTIVEFSDYQ